MKPPKQAPWNNSLTVFSLFVNTHARRVRVWIEKWVATTGFRVAQDREEERITTTFLLLWSQSAAPVAAINGEEGKERSSSSAPEVNWSSSSGGLGK